MKRTFGDYSLIQRIMVKVYCNHYREKKIEASSICEPWLCTGFLCGYAVISLIPKSSTNNMLRRWEAAGLRREAGQSELGAYR